MIFSLRQERGCAIINPDEFSEQLTDPFSLKAGFSFVKLS